MRGLIGLLAGLSLLAILVPKVTPELTSYLLAPPPVVAPQDNGNGTRIAIPADNRGHYMVDAVINGRSVSMMMDTGATIVALNAETAHRLGIDPAASDYSMPLATANGVVKSARVTLSEIRIGRVAVRNVEAAIVPGDGLPVSLLGMSFLSRLSRFEIAGGELVLVE